MNKAREEMQQMIAEQRRQTREMAEILQAQVTLRQSSSATFTMLDAAREVMPGDSATLISFLQASGKMMEGSFHNM